jgi:26S proteasome regulatory subunit N12
MKLRNRIPESPYRYLLLGLNLLCLLSQNRLADFHTVIHFIYRIS